MEKNIQLPFQNSYAFLVGINDYQHVSSLRTAVNDANMLAKQLAEHHGYQVMGPLLNASKVDLVRLLEIDIPKRVGVHDRIIFYFAGHGIALDSDNNPKGYLVPADAKPNDIDSLVSMDLLHNAITSLPCKHGMMILDCCFAGAFKWSTGFRDVIFDLPAIIYEERFYRYVRDPAWQVITSSASDQKAVDVLSNRTLGMRNEDGAKHSPFALALLEGLTGEADTIPKDRVDGVITATELYTYLRDRVEDQTSIHGKRQSPSIFSLRKHDKGQFIFLNPRHPLNLLPIPRRNPFMGLQSYNEDDNLLFFGRDRVIVALDDLINNKSLVVVSGSSGTGKSSVIKAGLLPLLRKKGWNILPLLRPGEEPFKRLKTEIPNLSLQLSKTGRNLLIIDQYEELITQCLDPSERVAFEDQLAIWIEAYPQLSIVISIRSDFEPQFEQASLAAWWQLGRYIIPAFSQDELREAIIKPTIQEVLFFEPDSLVDILVDAVNQAPGALPLLSFTLSELYHAYLNSGRNNRAFSLVDYEKLGGVIGALRTRANAIYDELDEAHQDSMRKLLLRMVSLEGGELASRQVSNEDLIYSNTEETDRIQSIAQQLVSARLISAGQDKQGQIHYEPVHDALIRSWARLWEWIRSQGEGKLGLMYKLGLAISDHNANKHSAKDYLWNDDPRLGMLYADLQAGSHGFNAMEENFLKKSMLLRNRNARRRRTIFGVAMVVLLAISGVAVWQWFVASNRLSAFRKSQENILMRELNKLDKSIYSLNYELADTILRDVISLGIPNPRIRPAAFTLIYYFNESGAQELSVDILREIGEFSGEKFPIKSLNSYADLRQIIKNRGGPMLFEALENRYYPQLVGVQGGSFWMGDSLGKPDETPHKVSLPDFKIGKYEITVFQYELYLKSKRRTLKELPKPTWLWEGDNPIINVDWYQAIEYCNWLSIRKGLKSVYTIHRDQIDLENQTQVDKSSWRVDFDRAATGFMLPTEAQWEFAAGGGHLGRDSLGFRNHKYSGSNNIHEVGWYSWNCDSLFGISRTLSVGKKAPNEIGLYDMTGNVFEWCYDWYGNDYYAQSNHHHPLGPTSGRSRVLRGGSWAMRSEKPNDQMCRITNRHAFHFYPLINNNLYGFRIAIN